MQPAYFIASTEELNQSIITLEGDEAHHAIKVRRTELNEIILVTDTKGLVVEAKVVEIGPGKILKAEIINKKQHKIQNPIVCVAQAVAKGDRADLSIEILTEVGVDKIIPWQANRSVSKLENKTEKLIQKWQSISRESTKQARRSFMPEILNLVNSKDLVDEFQNFENIIVLDPDSSVNFTDAIKNISNSILLVIGPEGGIDETEMTLFKNANVVFASLGESILRTSSAGAISAAILLAQTKWIK
ncbi:MAG: 16S rRNA (uracil(1498)-N(3))-methyltransferase [Candidatus Nanopelagicales bacterium]